MAAAAKSVDGLELITPFLEPVAPYLRDPAVTEVMINGGRSIFVEVEGESGMREVRARIGEGALRNACAFIASMLGIDLDASPILDARLPDGSRVAAVLTPVSVEGTTLTIRKFRMERFRLDDLAANGTVDERLAGLLRGIVKERRNVIVSGGTGTGKTTMLNALCGLIPLDERLVVVEQTAELQLPHRNLVRLEERPPELDGDNNVRRPGVPMRALVFASLRQRPDRIVVGEVRNEAGFELLQAMNSGHRGVMCTLHADTAALAIPKLATYAGLAPGIRLNPETVLREIADSVHYVLHMERPERRRRAVELARVAGWDGQVRMETVWAIGNG